MCVCVCVSVSVNVRSMNWFTWILWWCERTSASITQNRWLGLPFFARRFLNLQYTASTLIDFNQATNFIQSFILTHIKNTHIHCNQFVHSSRRVLFSCTLDGLYFMSTKKKKKQHTNEHNKQKHAHCIRWPVGTALHRTGAINRFMRFFLT